MISAILEIRSPRLKELTWAETEVHPHSWAGDLRFFPWPHSPMTAHKVFDILIFCSIALKSSPTRHQPLFYVLLPLSRLLATRNCSLPSKKPNLTNIAIHTFSSLFRAWVQRCRWVKTCPLFLKNCSFSGELKSWTQRAIVLWKRKLIWFSK